MKGCPIGVGCAKGGLNPVGCCMGGWLVPLHPVWGSDVLDVGGACQFGPPVLLCGTGAVHWCCDLADGPMMFPLKDNESTNHKENIKFIQHAWKSPYHSFPNTAVPAWKGQAYRYPSDKKRRLLYMDHTQNKPILLWQIDVIRCMWKPPDKETLCSTFRLVKQLTKYQSLKQCKSEASYNTHETCSLKPASAHLRILQLSLCLHADLLVDLHWCCCQMALSKPRCWTQLEPRCLPWMKYCQHYSVDCQTLQQNHHELGCQMGLSRCYY